MGDYDLNGKRTTQSQLKLKWQNLVTLNGELDSFELSTAALTDTVSLDFTVHVVSLSTQLAPEMSGPQDHEG